MHLLVFTGETSSSLNLIIDHNIRSEELFFVLFYSIVAFNIFNSAVKLFCVTVTSKT